MHNIKPNTYHALMHGLLTGMDAAGLLIELDYTMARMQTPEAKEGIRKAFNATPAELGRAAVEAAKAERL